jgi:2-dehydro-3-deoxygluconokinase
VSPRDVSPQDAFDVATFGEAMLRLSVPIGGRLGIAPAFGVHVGGSEANLAVALARLGRRVGWSSRLPDTALSWRVADTIRAAGVDVTGIRWVEKQPVGYVLRRVARRTLGAARNL